MEDAEYIPMGIIDRVRYWMISQLAGRENQVVISRRGVGVRVEAPASVEHVAFINCEYGIVIQAKMDMSRVFELIEGGPCAPTIQ